MTSTFRRQSLSRSAFERSPTKLWMLSVVFTYGCNDSTLVAERAYKLMLTFASLSWRYLRSEDPVEPGEISAPLIFLTEKTNPDLKGLDR